MVRADIGRDAVAGALARERGRDTLADALGTLRLRRRVEANPHGGYPSNVVQTCRILEVELE